ncbi:MAG: type II secretion system protein N [Mariprofundaceae bacterium]|nr:type II secretion system protein N [Mariprofundaceae bacterium]
MDLIWFDKQIVWLTKTVEFLLVGLVAWLVVGLVLSTLPQGITVPLAQTMHASAKTVFPLQELVESALFGKEPAKTVISVPKVAPPPKPKVKVFKQLKLVLELKGIVYAGHDSVAFIIAKPGDKQKTFRVGDEISTDVTLKRFAMDSIYVETQGQEQQVWMDFETINQAPSNMMQQPAPMDPMMQNPAMANMQNGRRGVRPGGLQRSPKRVVRQISRKMLDAELQDFSKLLMQARVLPHLQNGKPDGFMISNIASGSLYQTIGLMNGDVIQMVNGVPIRSMEQAMTLYQQLRSAPKVEISLMRQGQLQHIQFDIQ